MITFPSRLVFALLVVFALPQLLLSQATNRRVLQYGYGHYFQAGEYGTLKVLAGARDVEWFWNTGTQSDTRTITLALGTFSAGSITHIGSRAFLVTGKSGSNGVLARLRCVDTPTRAIIIDELKLVPGKDFLRATWNPADNEIYVLDLVQKEVLHGAWNGSGVAFPVTLQKAVGITELPLFSADLLDLWVGTRSGQPGFTVRQKGAASCKHVMKVGTTWVTSTLTVASHGLTFRNLDKLTVHQAEVSAPQATVFEVVDVATGAVVHNGSVPNPGATVNVTFAPALVPGKHYQLRVPGQSSGEDFRPLLRYGLPQSLSDLKIGQGELPASRARTGEMMFGVGASVERTPAQPQTQVLSGAIWVALSSGAPGSDPVTIQGNVAVLQPTTVLWLGVTIEQDRTKSAAAYPMPVPNDPSLIGQRVLFQILVLHPVSSQLVFSDVFATTIWGPAAPSPTAAGGAAAKATLPRHLTKKLSRLARRWKSKLDDKTRATVRRWTASIWKRFKKK